MSIRVSEASARKLAGRAETARAPRKGAAATDGRRARQKPAQKLTAGRGSEHAEQAALMAMCAHYAGQHPELALLFAVPNGARTSMSVAVKLKAEGLKAGVPDLILPVARKGHHSLYIELKYGRNKPSPEQEWWMDRLTDEGHRVVVCYSAEDALNELLTYLGGVSR